MTIREAEETDIPAIVDVLRVSLGEELPISEEIWRYKHINNPFGPSIVLLAEENEELLGVRAFMQWKWQKKNSVYTAFRAVDTATHPAHRGKGIFRKLTLAAVERAKEEGAKFIFNTPNEQSRPGYLKMGWELVGRIGVSVKPSLRSFCKLSSRKKHPVINMHCSSEKINDLCASWNHGLFSKNGFYTPKSSEYLKWRFESNPLQKYAIYASSHLYLSAGIKKQKNIKELRITECIFDNEMTQRQIEKIIKEWCMKYGIQVISFTPALLELDGFVKTGAFGPVFTLREVNLESREKAELLNIGSWFYSLGDLELF